MELTNETDQPLVIGALTLSVIVFILDSLVPSEVAVYMLYAVPLGLSRWSNHKHLTFILAGAITALIVFAHLLNPGAIQEVALTNRVLGIVMVWVVAFFLKVEKF